MMKMSVEVSMVKRQLAEVRGILSYAATLLSAPFRVAFAAHSSVISSMLAVGAVATAVPEEAEEEFLQGSASQSGITDC